MSAQKTIQLNQVDQILMQQLNTLYAFSFLLCHDTKHASALTKDAIVEARRTHDRRDVGLNLEHHVLQQLWEQFQPSTETNWMPSAAPLEYTILGKNKFEIAFHEAISNLKNRAGIIIFLCDGALLSPLEAGLVLRLPISTVRSRLYRARATLRKNLNSFEDNKNSVEAQTLADPIQFKKNLQFIMRQRQIDVPFQLQQEIELILLPKTNKDPRSTILDPKMPLTDRKWQFFLTLILILSLSATAYFVAPSPQLTAPLGNDLITRTAAASDNIKMILPDDRALRVQEFIQSHFNIRVTLPIIQDATLVGLGTAQIMPNISVPALIYTQSDGRRLSIFIYNYNLLDKYRNFISLNAGLQLRLIDDHHYEMSASGYKNYYVITWRRRAAVLVAVTDRLPESLLARIEE